MGPFGMDVLQSTLGKLGLRCWAGCGCCVLDGRALRAECWVLLYVITALVANSKQVKEPLQDKSVISDR